MEQVVPWRELSRWSSRIIPSLGRGGGRWEWSACCGFIFAAGFTCRTRRWKEALYDSAVMRQFVGIDLAVSRAGRNHGVQVPALAGSTQLGEQILGQVNLHLQAQGVRITTARRGRDHPARPLDQERSQQRDPECSRREGQTLVLADEGHVGVIARRRIIHTAVANGGHVADSAVLPDLLHGEERGVGRSGLSRQSEVIRECAPQPRTAPIGATLQGLY